MENKKDHEFDNQSQESEEEKALEEMLKVEEQK